MSVVTKSSEVVGLSSQSKRQAADSIMKVVGFHTQLPLGLSLARSLSLSLELSYKGLWGYVQSKAMLEVETIKFYVDFSLTTMKMQQDLGHIEKPHTMPNAIEKPTVALHALNKHQCVILSIVPLQDLSQ